MNREHRIIQLCERLRDRFRNNISYNCFQHQPFYPNGTAYGVFANNREDLEELLRHAPGPLLVNVNILPQVVGLILDNLCDVLGTILQIIRPENVRILDHFLGIIITHDGVRQTLPLMDSQLPISESRAEQLFPLVGRPFFLRQFRFCAVTLKQEEEVMYEDEERSQCVLPYLRERWVGGGAFGQVYEVRIERRHFRSTYSENREPLTFARKDFRVNQTAFQNELVALRNLMRRPQRHDHLVTVQAILRHNGTYSLFFALATCDLAEYFNSPRTPVVPQSMEKKSIYQRGIALAGALAFLHQTCLHLDLKPRNILVYNAGDHNETWKITDFGISRVRYNAAVSPDGDPSTTARGVDGTYFAPECVIVGGRVNALSDVWSLGCILSLVITFITAGQPGIAEFSRKRALQPEGDYFYVDASRPRLSPRVIEWFETLKNLTANTPQQGVVHHSLNYLRSHVLLPDRNSRPPTSHVERTLTEICDFDGPRPPPLSAPQPTSPRDSSARGWFRRALGARPSPTIDLGRQLRGIRFSPEGDHLVCVSPDKNATWGVSQLRDALEHHQRISSLLQNPIHGNVACFAVSSNFICIGLDGDYFKCHIHPIHENARTAFPDSYTGFISRLRIGSIKMVALSADGMFSAFIITQRPNGSDLDCSMYLCKTDELIAESNNGRLPSTPSTRSDSAISGRSSESGTNRASVYRAEPSVGPAAGTRFLGFTSDGRYLVRVSQPNTTAFDIQVWRSHAGTCHSSFQIPYMGTESATGTNFTAGAVLILNGALGLVILSQERYLIYVDLFERTWEIRELDQRMIHLQSSYDDQILILLSLDRRRVYTLPTYGILESPLTERARLSTSTRTTLPGLGVRNYAGGQRELLIVTAEGNFSNFYLGPSD